MITCGEYQIRRKTLASRLPAGSIGFFPAAKEHLRNGDVQYRFRQDSDFYYLTGFNEPDGLLVLFADTQSTVLFIREWQKSQEIWTGKHLSVDEAAIALGIEQVYPLSQLQQHLPQLLLGKTAVYYPISRDLDWESTCLRAIANLKQQVRKGETVPSVLGDIGPIISELRLFKSNAEIAALQRAVDVSVAAHQQAMQHCSSLAYEYQLEGILRHAFFQHGCQDVAYEPIVAGGANACTLHYTANNMPLDPQGLVLIDAGAEWQNYAADITRTFPSNGRFSAPQREIYELVLWAQRQAIALIRPGVSWDAMQNKIVNLLTQGLVDLGLLQGNVEDLIAQEAYRVYYMHGSGHWLGLDVHDAGAYKIDGHWRSLQAGMVLTVEPGLYIAKDAEVDARWQGIGVRIEDDILVTSDGHCHLSKELVSAVPDVEALLRG